MLERKIKECVGNLRTLKTCRGQAVFSEDLKACDNLETDCMVKLALLFPLLPEQEFPQEIEEMLLELRISQIPVLMNEERDYTKIAFRVDSQRVLVDCRTGAVSRVEPQYSIEPILGIPIPI